MSTDSPVTFDTKVRAVGARRSGCLAEAHVVAFLATGIAAAQPPEADGRAVRRRRWTPYANMLGQRCSCLACRAPTAEGAQHRPGARPTVAAVRGCQCSRPAMTVPTRGVQAEPADAPDLVGLAVRGRRKDVERATKGRSSTRSRALCRVHSRDAKSNPAAPEAARRDHGERRQMPI